jgi:hypothetical protein
MQLLDGTTRQPDPLALAGTGVGRGDEIRNSQFKNLLSISEGTGVDALQGWFSASSMPDHCRSLMSAESMHNMHKLHSDVLSQLAAAKIFMLKYAHFEKLPQYA